MQQNKKNKKDNADTLRKNFEDKLPKNVRQIGNVSQSTKIYIEEYVLNYLKRVQKERQENEKIFSAVLIGEKHVAPKTIYYFIQGAVELNINVKENSKAMPEPVRKQLSRTIESYFGKENSALCQLGWASQLQVEGKIPAEYETFHRENFGSGNMIFLGFYEDGEEVFYINENGKLKKQDGYYVYFERNEGMQQYVEDNQPTECVEMEQTVNEKSGKYRMMLASHKEEIQHKRVIAFLYTASTFLVMVVIVLGVTLINHYDKLKEMQNVIASLSQSVLNSPSDEVMEVSNDSVSENSITSDSLTMGDISASDNSASVSEAADQTLNTSVETSAQSADVEQNIDSDNNEGDSEDSQDDSSLDDSSTDDESPSEKTEDNVEALTDKAQYEQFMSEQFRCYVVQEGDTLTGICRKLYGSQEYFDKICEYNHIENTDEIKVGQKIWVP